MLMLASCRGTNVALDGEEPVELAAGGAACASSLVNYSRVRLGRCALVLAVALAASGCANKQVALDGDNELELAAGGATSEGAIVRRLHEEGQLLVDDERLYWVNRGTLHGCSKGSCASSLIEYYSWPDELTVHDPEISWLASEGGDFLWATRSKIMSCPRAGCGGEPSVLGSSKRLYPRAVDETSIVSGNEDGIYVMPRAGGDWHRLVEKAARYAPDSLELHAGYIYWIEGSLGDVEKGGELLRVREQGTTEVETLARNLVGANGTEIAFDASFVYFTDRRQNGAILRCPLDGCPGEPEEVIRPLRSPDRLAVDERGVCVSYSLGEHESAVGCAKTAAQPLQQRGVDTSRLTMDADFVYALHASRVFDAGNIELTWDIYRWER
jgi:hypothetical protein